MHDRAAERRSLSRSQGTTSNGSFLSCWCNPAFLAFSLICFCELTFRTGSFVFCFVISFLGIRDGGTGRDVLVFMHACSRVWKCGCVVGVRMGG